IGIPSTGHRGCIETRGSLVCGEWICRHVAALPSRPRQAAVMRIVVTFAVPSEFAYWRRAAGFKRMEEAGSTAFWTKRGDDEIYGVITGIGMHYRRNDLRQLFSKTADLCIVSGLTGGLKDEYRAGSILVGIAARGDDSSVALESSRAFVDLAARCGAKVVNLFYTARSVVTASSEKRRLGRIADAIDMETFDIMNEAHSAGIPAVAIRAVSDPAENDLPVNFQRVIN